LNSLWKKLVQMPAYPEQSVTTVARLACDAATARRLADALTETFESGEAVVGALEDAAGGWSVEVHFAKAPDAAALRDVVATITGPSAAHALVFETVTARDWVAASLAGLKPVSAGRFLVHGAHDRSGVPANRVGIEVEAALAFGTGHHGTTRGCLLALDALLKRGLRSARPNGRRPRREARILDIGTGTGVLAIAAAKALRGRVLASDIDRRAVDVARANARLNGVGALVDVVHAGGLSARRLRERAPFDLVFANILLPPIKRLAAPIAHVLAPGAHVVLSGLLASQAPAALAAYGAQGLALAACIPLDEWVTLILTRSHRPGRNGRAAPIVAGRQKG
jgi:ribosomal protein L11 methyltransferase